MERKGGKGGGQGEAGHGALERSLRRDSAADRSRPHVTGILPRITRASGWRFTELENASATKYKPGMLSETAGRAAPHFCCFSRCYCCCCGYFPTRLRTSSSPVSHHTLTIPTTTSLWPSIGIVTRVRRRCTTTRSGPSRRPRFCWDVGQWDNIAPALLP